MTPKGARIIDVDKFEKKEEEEDLRDKLNEIDIKEINNEITI